MWGCVRFFWSRVECEAACGRVECEVRTLFPHLAWRLWWTMQLLMSSTCFPWRPYGMPPKTSCSWPRIGCKVQSRPPSQQKVSTWACATFRWVSIHNTLAERPCHRRGASWVALGQWKGPAPWEEATSLGLMMTLTLMTFVTHSMVSSAMEVTDGGFCLPLTSPEDARHSVSAYLHRQYALCSQKRRVLQPWFWMSSNGNHFKSVRPFGPLLFNGWNFKLYSARWVSLRTLGCRC